MPTEVPMNYMQETMTPELKRLRIMIHNFCRLEDSSLLPKIDLRQYGIESGQVITNSTVQQLCSVHTKIQQLDLTNCNQVSDVGLWAIARHLIHLQLLNCTGCTQITTVGLRSISLRCSEIIELNLSNCLVIDDDSLTVIAGGAWRLQRLSLENCHRVSDNAIAKLSKGQGEYLLYLNLNGCTSFGEFGDRGLKELSAYCHNLQELYINAAKRIEDTGLIALALGCPVITHLTLSGCENISKKALKQCAMQWSKMLHFNFQKNTKLQDTDFAVFIDSPMAQSLRSITLQKVSNLGDKGVAMICKALSPYQTIHTLTFIDCHMLTDYSSMIIGNFCPQLRCLDVTNCGHFTDESIHILARKCRYLTSLKLDGNKKITTKTLLSHITSSSEILEFVDMSNQWLGYAPKPSVEKLITLRKQVQLFHTNATKIQSLVRRKFADRIYWMKYRERLLSRAIPLFQAVIRGVQQRTRYALIRFQMNRIRSVIKIQAKFRAFQAYQVCKVIVQRRKYEAYCNTLALLIQRLFRGYQARKYTIHQRAVRANEQLKASRVQAIKEVKAIEIQRLFRGVQAREYAKSLDLARYLRQQQAKRVQFATRLIARIVRGFVGRCKAIHRREELRLAAYRWHCAREIQRVYRGLLGRRRYDYFYQLRQLAIQTIAATQIQRIYRGYRGRLLSSLARALRLLRLRQQDCAVLLQRFLRGCMGRHHFNVYKELETRRLREIVASKVIQRIYRGHKGREAYLIEKQLQSLEGQAKPLIKHLQQIEDERNIMAKLVSKLESQEKRLHENLFEIERELEHCNKTTSKYTDSHRINNTPQRFLTKFLRIRLKDHFEHEQV